MATANRCSVDQKDLGPMYCTGCDQYFCRRHFRSHQDEMFSEMDRIIQERDRLQDLINKELQINDQQNPIIEKINQWQDRTIKMVKQVAAQACQQALDLLNVKRVKLNTELESFTKQLIELKESENYVEHDLKRLNDTIKKFKRDLEQVKQPTTIEFHTEQADKINWATLMYVEEKKIKENVQTFIPSPLPSQRQIIVPTPPTVQSQLKCGGKACAKCGACSDCYRENNAYKLRSGATCRSVHTLAIYSSHI